MGIIVNDVKSVFLKKYPDQEKILKPFLSGFDVTYSEKREVNNTVLFIYMLKPEKFIKEGFGLDKEILLAYSPFDELQPRALQGINMLFSVYPFRNRVDTLNCFVVSKDKSIFDYSGVTSFSENESRAIVPFLLDDLNNNNDSWYIRNVLRKNFYDVDLFGYSLPLRDEASFFGRQQVIARYIDAVKRCENRGIFGLRKTGKTSLLFKLERIVREQQLGFVFYYDCKSPSYRKMHWNEFLDEICDNIAKRLDVSISKEYDEKSIIKSFRYVMKIASERNKKIIIMFDEIEYISFKSPTDKHWHDEFIDFWQTIWSVQSLHRNLVFILSGVNPGVAEIDTINGIQNPLFSIVQYEYLTGLSEEETHSMIRTLGRRMGINFDYQAIKKLFDLYNGHPLLLRLACSYINRQYISEQRPITISVSNVERIQDDIDVELAYYFKHVVSEIHQFYPDEYEMFEMLASGQKADFVELSSMTDLSKHLYDYGLVAKDENNSPFVKMPVAGRYVAMELAKKENRKSLYKLIEEDKRCEWLKQRIKSIIRDMRQLETAIRSSSKDKLFGENSFPEADRFAELVPVTKAYELQNFFNVCNRCFVESIENYGVSIGKPKYFWNEIKTSYPSLFEILERIKVYRHSEDHSKLNPIVAKKYISFFKEDTKGFDDENEQRFAIQQKLIENFHAAIQIELSEIS